MSETKESGGKNKTLRKDHDRPVENENAQGEPLEKNDEIKAPSGFLDQSGPLTLDERPECTTCPLAAKLKDDKLRALAEVENFKKRIEREKEEFVKFASEGVLEDLLPVIDNLELALVHAGNAEACKALIQGVDMTRKIFLDKLKKHGLETVGALGDTFDPAVHQAVAQEDSSEYGPGKVTKILQAGYRLKGRLLRPASVVVSKLGLEKDV